MAQVKIQNLTFSYDGYYENIFENVNFSFDTDWKIGLIGRNGRGKTTFLNLLLGKFKYNGKIVASTHFDYFPYEVKNKERMSIDLVEEISPETELWKVMKNFKDLDLNESCLYQYFNTLSNGEQTKLLLAILFAKENNFLLIDEPTNHLDYKSQESVKNFLSKQKGFIIVSHSRDLIDCCVDHIISINKNDIEIQKGNFSTWWINRQNQDNFELMQNERLKKDILKLQESAKERLGWATQVEKSKNKRVSGLRPDKGYIGHKSAKMAKSAKVIEQRRNKAIEEKGKLLKNIEKQDDLFLNSIEIKKETIIVVKDLSIFYGDKEVAKNINFNVEYGDKLAVCGVNGSGKTSLLKILCGEDIKHYGKIYKDSKLKISYVSQQYEWTEGNLIEFAKEYKLDQTKFFTMLFKLGFKREQFNADIKKFSEGEKKKILIAKSLCEEANLYIWDEPLNYIDVISRLQIEHLLENTDITLIFVEHDMTFVKNIANKIVNI